MNSPLYFVAGLPRTGSTLLMNLLGQNPAHYVTPTSGLIELFVMIKNRWPEFLEFKAEGLEMVKPRILGALRGLLAGYYEPEYSAGKTVFDKSRGWLQYIEPLEEALGRRVRVIVTVRDVRAIIASFETLYRKRSIEYREPTDEAFFQCQTIEGRAEVLLNPKSVLGLTIARLRDALARGMGDRLVIIPYRALTTCPQETLTLLHMALGLQPYEYDPQNVAQITHEDDHFHGMPLHTIRSQVEPPLDCPWQGILPERLSKRLAEEYADIGRLATWCEDQARFRPLGPSYSHEPSEVALSQRESPRQILQSNFPAASNVNTTQLNVVGHSGIPTSSNGITAPATTG
jgi:sulfotransferase